MGMFDYVALKCPGCREEIVLQSKAGPCDLRVIYESDVPGAVADDIKGRHVCPHCMRLVIVDHVSILRVL
jgi:hypothetical protein